MDKIDSLDKKILCILAQNARKPFKDVAEECNVSRAAIHQRVQRLKDEGVIMGSGFDVNPKSLGYSTCTYVGITLERGSMYKDVVERLWHIPEIVECHFTTGPYTMLVKLYARDNEQLMDLLKQLEADNASVGSAAKPAVNAVHAEGMQLSFFQLDDPVLCQIRDEVLGLDIDHLTPVEALNKLNDIKKIVKGK